MAYHKIPISPNLDQTFNVAIDVNGVVLGFDLRLTYNFEGHFWKLDIMDGITKEMILSNVPLVTGNYPAHNILRQFRHLGIGELYVISATDDVDEDRPTGKDLGTDFYLVWGDLDG